MSNIKSVLFLGFPNFGEQDLFAAWELFRSLAWTLFQQGQQLEVSIGSFKDGLIHTHMGAEVQSQKKLNPSDRFDVLYVPGGIGAGEASKDPVVLDFIRAHHKEGKWVAANCAGVGVLYRAGVLNGLQITTPATLYRRLPALGADVMSPRRAWKIDTEHKIFTSGGAATVHPSTIALVNELFGEEAARGLATAWDSLALHGEVLFDKQGPVMNDNPQSLPGLQDAFEKVFLPD
ncbi:DJ-1/PfpI family protein [Acinetobacter nosocomialis]|uniref:DJ-1/PfpI family protein n=1 Tax=Acinetobacter nosocomialis TaxID=106654 RepID=UPI0025A16DC3|nr:DJ-1/PfpI family protein [Acinetobacter nosocomialis]